MKKTLLAALAALIAAALVMGCVHQYPPGATGPEGASAPRFTDTIVVAGSTTVTPLMRQLAAAFETQYGATIEVQELGTSAGINATLQGVSDMSMASRAITAAEQANGLVPVRIAFDGVGIVVHPSNPVTDLSVAQIEAIFRGDITNWAAVGGNDQTINVVSREDGSGIRATFEAFANVRDTISISETTVWVSAVTDQATIAQGTGSVIAAVSGNPAAVGYITTGVVADNLTMLSVDGVPFSAASVIAETYAFANTFYVGATENMSEAAQAFIDFILSEEGQNIVAETGYVRIG